MRLRRIVTPAIVALTVTALAAPVAVSAQPATTPPAGTAASKTSQAAAILVRPKDLTAKWKVTQQPGNPTWSPAVGTPPDGQPCSGVEATLFALPWTGEEPWPGYAATVLSRKKKFIWQLGRTYRNAADAQRDYDLFLASATPCQTFTATTEIGELPVTMTPPEIRTGGSGLSYRFVATSPELGTHVVAVGVAGRFMVVTSTTGPAATADRAEQAALARGVRAT